MERYAIIGLAAGTSARQASEVFASVKIDGFEIDREIVAVGREYFGMTMPNLTVYIEDGRWGLEHSPAPIRPDRRGRLPPALHPAAHDHAGILPDRLRPPDRRRRAGHQRRARAQATAA